MRNKDVPSLIPVLSNLSLLFDIAVGNKQTMYVRDETL